MSRRLSLAAILVGALVATTVASAQPTMLEPGVVNTFQLNQSSVTTALAVDIDGHGGSMKIQARSTSGANIDLLVRHGEPFELFNLDGGFGGTTWLYEQAHFRSVSGGPIEEVTIRPHHSQPLRTGRWYLSVLNYGDETTTVEVEIDLSGDDDHQPAEFLVDFNDRAGCEQQHESGGVDPWFDDTPATPVDGNTGATLGEQRRNAFLHAMEEVRQQAWPTVPVHIRACWAELGGEDDRATLASAGPYLLRDDNTLTSNAYYHLPGIEKTYTWYSFAAAAQQAGTSSCRFIIGGNCSFPLPDVYIQFNSDLGDPDIIGGRDFHLGYGAPPANRIDFVATAMHEIIHGLGFASLLNTNDENDEAVGAKFRGNDPSQPDGRERLGHNDAFTDAVVHVRGEDAIPINELPLSERADSLTSGAALRWADPEAVLSPANPWNDRTFPDNLPRMYAPAELEPGSTLSHLDLIGQPQQMMAPFVNNGLRDLGMAAPMLAAAGWPKAERDAPGFALPYGGQWYDPSRAGHGIDLQRVVGLPDVYFLILYTYDEDGLPEWYTSTGRVVDGVFRPADDNNGNSLWRWRSPGQLDDDFSGQIRIDFNQAGNAPECWDDDSLALMTFSAGPRNQAKNHRWCLTQLLPEAARPDFDTTGTWYAGEQDSGWGISTLALPGANGVGLNLVVYYHDASNQPRWAIADVTGFQSGQTLPMSQIAGYCRDCDIPAAGLVRTTVGEAVVHLDPPQGSDGRISLDISFDGPGGGRFQRTDSPMVLLGTSEPLAD